MIFFSIYIIFPSCQQAKVRPTEEEFEKKLPTFNSCLAGAKGPEEGERATGAVSFRWAAATACAALAVANLRRAIDVVFMLSLRIKGKQNC